MATQASGAAATSAATDSSGAHAPGHGGSQSSFSYGSAQSQQQQQQLQPAPGSAMQSQQPPPASPMGPSFSYNISQPAVDFQGNQQFQPSMHVAPAHTLMSPNTPPSTAASSQSPSHMRATHPNSYVPAKSMPPPTPILTGASSTASSFSFNGNPQYMQKDQSFKINTSTAIAQGATTSSFMPTFSQPVPMPTHTSQMTTMSPSAPNLGTATSLVTTALSFSVPPGMPGTPGIPGPPGLAASAPISSNLTVSSSTTESSSSTSLRPSLLTSSPLNPVVQQQIYPQYPSLPSMNPYTQGSWLQPPQLGGVPRPPFLPYPSAYPGSYPMPARGMPLPSVPLPDSQPPGVTPVGSAGALHMSSASSGHQLASSLTVPTEVTPPGTDNGKQYTKDETAVSEHLDAWTAHKTDTGVVYYYNALTGVSTYEKPPGFKGEAERVTAAPTSVSVENLVSTDWALVTTNDGKKFYYNNKTKLSSWQMPSEVAELKKQQEGDVSKEQSMPVSNINVLAEKGTTSVSMNAPIINTGGRDAIALRTSSLPGSSSALDLIKKKLQDSGAPVATSVPALSGTTGSELNGSRAVEATVKGLHTENSKDKLRDANGDGNMSDSSSDSEDADSGPTKEECIIQFKEMLKERGVAPFSKWEKELPKIVFDPRFKAIPSYSARRSIFEHYVKTRAEEERKEKRAAQKAAIERFKQLLDEAMEDIDHNTNYQTFKKKWGNDPRFETLDRKDRELLLNERVLPLKRAVEEKVRAERAAAAASFKSMLKEKGDVNVNSRWSRVKDGLRNDPRYKLVKHEDREVLFNEYVSELKAVEQEAEQEAKTKRDEQEKLKERERELRKRKEREEHEMERVRLKVRRKEAVSSFQALLMETIKDPQASWTESKTKLEKDPQRRASNPDLDPSDTEKLFREHIKMLYERCANEFRALLGDVLTTEAASRETEDGKTVLNSWSTAKRLLKPDPRYNKMPRKDREALWRRYADDMLRKQQNQKEEKHTDAKTKHSVDSGSWFSSGTRKASDRR